MPVAVLVAPFRIAWSETAVPATTGLVFESWVATVGALYMLVNAAVQFVLPADAIAASPRPASDAVGLAWGALGASVVSAAMAVSMLVPAAAYLWIALASDRNVTTVAIEFTAFSGLLLVYYSGLTLLKERG